IRARRVGANRRQDGGQSSWPGAEYFFEYTREADGGSHTSASDRAGAVPPRVSRPGRLEKRGLKEGPARGHQCLRSTRQANQPAAQKAREVGRRPATAFAQGLVRAGWRYIANGIASRSKSDGRRR